MFSLTKYLAHIANRPDTQRNRNISNWTFYVPINSVNASLCNNCSSTRNILITIFRIVRMYGHTLMICKTVCIPVQSKNQPMFFKYDIATIEQVSLYWASMRITRITLSSETKYFFSIYMMTSSNGNVFRVTGHFCGEFTDHRWIPRTKASDAELWCFLWSPPE